MDENLLLLADTSQIGPQSGLRCFGNQLAPLLGAEHHVDGVVGVGMGHVSRLRRSNLTSQHYPRRCRGLTCGRASGAQVLAVKSLSGENTSSRTKIPKQLSYFCRQQHLAVA